MKNKKKIAFFVHSMRDGGAERVILTMANACAAKGLDTDLVLGRARGPYMADVRPELNVVSLNTNKPVLGVIRLARYLRANKPFTMLSTTTLCNLATVFSNILAGNPTRVVIRESNHMSSYWSNPSAHPFLMRATRFLVPFLYKRADEIVTVSKGVAKDLMKTYKLSKDKVHPIYSPLITDEQASLAKEVPEHKWFKETIPIIITAGRLSFEKDHETMIRAVHKVRETHNVRLIILGEGPLRGSLNTLIKDLDMSDCVDMPGFTLNPFSYMSHASVFVLSSITDAMPGSLVQAMACGCPVVSTDCPSGPSELLNKGEFGLLTRVGDAGDMAEAIIKTLDNKNKRIDNSRLKQFTSEVSINEHFKLLRID